MHAGHRPHPKVSTPPRKSSDFGVGSRTLGGVDAAGDAGQSCTNQSRAGFETAGSSSGPRGAAQRTPLASTCWISGWL